MSVRSKSGRKMGLLQAALDWIGLDWIGLVARRKVEEGHGGWMGCRLFLPACLSVTSLGGVFRCLGFDAVPAVSRLYSRVLE